MNLPTLPTYMFEPDLQGLLSLFLTIALPVLVGLLTKATWSASLKALLLLFLSAVKSVVEAAIAGGGDFSLTRTVYTVGLNFAIAIVIHYGLWKPTGATGAAQSTLVRD